jgi:hypothetical protein
MPPLATEAGLDPEPTRDWEVYSISNGPAQLIGWAQAASAQEACQEVAKIAGIDVMGLIAIRRR